MVPGGVRTVVPEAAPTRPLARPGPGQSSLPDADCPLYLPGLKREYANHAQNCKVCRWASKESGVHPPDSLRGGHLKVGASSPHHILPGAGLTWSCLSKPFPS